MSIKGDHQARIIGRGRSGVVYLEQGRSSRDEATVRKVFGGGGKKISLSFQQLADGPVTRVSRSLGLQDLGPGTYRLVLSLTGPGGIELEQERRFEVVE